MSKGWYLQSWSKATLLAFIAIPALSAELHDWHVTDSVLRLRLNGDPALNYVIERSTNLTVWQGVIGTANGAPSRQFEFTRGAADGPVFFRALQTNEPLFRFAVATQHGLALDGNNLEVDSFDSGVPGRNVGGRWHAVIARDHAVVLANDTVTNEFGNLAVWGRLRTGTPGELWLGTNGQVGDKAWQRSAMLGIQPGHHSNDANEHFEELALPETSWLPFPPGGVISGVSYNAIFYEAGYYSSDHLVSGRIAVTASNVWIRAQGGWQFTGQDSMHVRSNASVTIILDCPSAVLTGHGIVNMGLPSQCRIYGTKKLMTLSASGGELSAIIYAPSSHMQWFGGGSSRSDFSGAIVARSFSLSGDIVIHFDEAVLRQGPFR